MRRKMENLTNPKGLHNLEQKNTKRRIEDLTKQKEFLQSVLSNKGSYCVWGYKGDSVIQKFYSSVDEAIEQTKYLDSNNYHTFFLFNIISL